MKCGSDYCIYNEDFECLLDEIEINSVGQCEECIIVSLPKEKLEQYKKEQLRKMIERDRDI